MSEAGSALIEHAFGTLNLHRIEADIDPRNVASARLLERLGFVREGLLRDRWIVGGEVSDSALYGLLERDRRANTDTGGSQDMNLMLCRESMVLPLVLIVTARDSLN